MRSGIFYDDGAWKVPFGEEPGAQPATPKHPDDRSSALVVFRWAGILLALVPIGVAAMKVLRIF